MPVDVQLATDIVVPEPAVIERWAQHALALAPVSASRAAADGEVCVRVVEESEIRRLNRDYRYQDRPTNVLSFPADIDLPDALVWGDVVVCAAVVEREAAAQGKQYGDHFAHMVVHGVLHLLGYDHASEPEARAMEQLEIRILDGLGVSDPYGEG